jgi:hypothetical protein
MMVYFYERSSNGLHNYFVPRHRDLHQPLLLREPGLRAVRARHPVQARVSG